MKTCRVENCDSPVGYKGLCHSHYMRLKRYGDPIAGGPPRGTPERFLREVVMAYRGSECLNWPYAVDGHGYAQVTIRGRNKQVASRVVCELVNGPPPSPDHQAAHSCGKGNEGCVSPSHLSWKTRSGNQADRLLHNTHARGEKHSLSKLTEPQVLKIRELSASIPKRQVADLFGVSRQTINDIQTGRSWGWLADDRACSAADAAYQSKQEQF